MVDSPYLSTHLFEESVTLMKRPYTTTDIIDLDGKNFKLLGRVNEIVKVSGKRISVVELENLIENELGAAEVLIGINKEDDRLKDECLDIRIAGRNVPGEKEVKALFKRHYPATNFSFVLTGVKSIEKNSMGKKVRR